jgi:hypothetical protein
MSPIAELVIAILLPTAAGYALIALARGWGWIGRARCKPVPPEPAELLAARLRRLRAELERTESLQGLTAKSHRVKALRGAYLDVLGDACLRFGVEPPPGGDQAGQAEIYRAEAALRGRGLDVRQPVMR